MPRAERDTAAGAAEAGGEGQAVKVVGTLSQQVVVGHLSDRGTLNGSGRTTSELRLRWGAGVVFPLPGMAVFPLSGMARWGLCWR